MWGLFFYLLIGLVFGYFEQKKMISNIRNYQEKLESLMKAKNEKTDFEHRMMYRSRILELDEENQSVLHDLKGIEMIGEDYYFIMTFIFYSLFWPVWALMRLIWIITDIALFIWFDCILFVWEWLWYDIFKIGIDSHDDEEEDV